MFHPAVKEIGFIPLVIHGKVWDGLERQLSPSPFYRWKPEAQRGWALCSGSQRGVMFLPLPLWETPADINL
uniref:Macaca fascicularis brain cDNA, clone: QflA-16593 n=1 Tax=Macaca fascicularis TaxID=9541 RepID=I7GL17_MACFA|nr:unnamed protein product [Macaca fascicularis]